MGKDDAVRVRFLTLLEYSYHNGLPFFETAKSECGLRLPFENTEMMAAPVAAENNVLLHYGTIASFPGKN